MLHTSSVNIPRGGDSSSRLPWESFAIGRMEPSVELLTRLRDAALEARAASHAPYSGFNVGAALASPTGEIFIGANIENASYGLTICAERVAMVHACMHGHREFQAMMVASPGGVAPCGACRQFLAEFVGDAFVGLVDADHPETWRGMWLTELLPHAFGGSLIQPRHRPETRP